MKFLEALDLGTTLFPRERWNPEYYCSCAVHMALLAIGRNTRNSFDIVDRARQEWPWLEGDGIVKLSMLFYDVCEGRMTFDEFRKWIESKENVERPVPELEPVLVR
jgi:hypothetical protein